jgi:trehalose 6-phosphate phosphatase
VNAPHDLPSALASFDRFTQELHGRHPVVFLDFDGTLAPIVAHHDQALLDADMWEAVRNLARRCPVAVVSGRDRQDVQARVELDLIYAGSHGFDIAGPNGLRREHEEAQALLPLLDAVQQELEQTLAPIDGADVERKKYAVAVHYRNTDASRVPEVEAAVDAILARETSLRKGYGKKVFELQPRLDWHKGRAVSWLLQALELDQAGVVPVYLGDDVTDEDAFETLAERGVGVAVQDKPKATAAQYVLKDPHEVRLFLERFTAWLER